MNRNLFFFISCTLSAVLFLLLLTAGPTCRPPDPEFCHDLGGECSPRDQECPEGQVQIIPNPCPQGEVCCAPPPQ